jgi:hypothetical protein
MITLTRSASIAPGKYVDAVAYAKQITKYLKEKHGVTTEIQTPIGGNPYRIAWQTHLPGLADLESLSAKLTADKEYLEMTAKNSALLLPGSLHDELWRTIVT